MPGVAAVVVLVAGMLAATVARAADASATLALDRTALTFGEPAAASGSLLSTAECLEGRAVELQARDAVEDWVTLMVTTTDASGAFVPTEVAPDHTGDIRAHVPATGSCPEATSSPVAVTVAVAVVFDPAVGQVETGKCATLVARVLPEKPGSTIHFQRRSGSSWVGLGEPALDDDSVGSARWCFDGWAAIGTKTVRAWWPDQDELNEAGATADTALEVTKAQWMRTIDKAAAGHAVSISVREAGRYLYRRLDGVSRAPASNEKLLLTMALLDRVNPDGVIATRAMAAEDPSDGVIDGDLWITGHGDPAIGSARITLLAQRVVDAGVVEVHGRVMGSTGYFARDWWAPGWRDYFPDDVIALPTALTYQGNWAGSNTVANPELRAARELKRALKALGVTVTGKAGMGPAPSSGLDPVAALWSSRIRVLLESMNVHSRNFYAEVLNKLLAVKAGTRPGTIAGGADAIEDYAAARGVTVTAHDGSGLSYANRVTASGLAILLGQAEGEPWGGVLADTLATPGAGTLAGRLSGVPVRAKTGTLDGISALSGYVWLERLGTWAEFSIVGANISKSTAVAIEDKVVRTLTSYGR